MRGDAAFTRLPASPFNRSFHPVEIFAAVLLGRLDDPSHPSVAGLAGRARADARTESRTGRALDEAERVTELRLAYAHVRADAAAIKPVVAIPPEGPRWWRVFSGLAALRHRQRGALTLFYVLGASIEETAIVLGVRAPEARKVIEAGVAQLVRAIAEPVDVRRALRTAGSRMTAEEPAAAAVRAVPARLPRSVVRALLAPVDPDLKAAVDELTSPPPAPGEVAEPVLPVQPVVTPTPTPLVTPAVLEQLEADGPDLVPPPPEPPRVEIVPASRRSRRRRDPLRARLALAAAAVAVLVVALLPAGAQGPGTIDDHGEIVGMVPAQPAQPEVAAPVPTVPQVVVVARGDSLWELSRRHLGDPMRWAEIWRLNRDRRMADGARFRSPDLILPGWRLRLPAA